MDAHYVVNRMTRMIPLTRGVTDALGMRRWAWQTLARRNLDPAPDASSLGMDLFLEAERSGLPLTVCVGGEPEPGIMQSNAGRLGERGLQERDRTSAAREHVKLAGNIATQLGWPIVALKGAAHLASPRGPYDLVDVDFLVRQDRARAFAAELDRRGYWPTGNSTARHVSERSNGSEVTIEIHTGLDFRGAPTPDAVWLNITPMPGVDGVYRLGPVDHLWHMLEHLALDHPERRSNLRELLLLGEAMDRCSTTQLAEVRQRLEQQPPASPFRLIFAAAEALAHGHGDLLAEWAAKCYSVRAILRSVRIPGVLEHHLYQWVYAILAGHSERRRLWEDIWIDSLDETYRWLVTLSQTAPRLGRTVRRVARLIRAGMAGAAALPTALLASRLGRRALDELNVATAGPSAVPRKPDE